MESSYSPRPSVTNAAQRSANWPRQIGKLDEAELNADVTRRRSMAQAHLGVRFVEGTARET